MLTTRRLTADDPLLRDWHEAVRDAHLADREPAWWESWEATRTYLARPADRTAYVVVAALDGDVVVGGAEVSLPLVDDTDTFSVVLGVRRSLRAAARAGQRQRRGPAARRPALRPGAARSAHRVCAGARGLPGGLVHGPVS